MTEHFERFGNRFREQIIAMAVFAIMFSALGYFVPRVYFQYFDHTEYYKIESPISMSDSPYKSCGIIPITIRRIALVDLHGQAVINLFLVNEKSKEKISQGTREMVITKGEVEVTTYWELPCGIKDGIYYWSGVVTYPLNGITRQNFFSTETFIVKK